MTSGYIVVEEPLYYKLEIVNEEWMKLKIGPVDDLGNPSSGHFLDISVPKSLLQLASEKEIRQKVLKDVQTIIQLGEKGTVDEGE